MDVEPRLIGVEKEFSFRSANIAVDPMVRREALPEERKEVVDVVVVGAGARGLGHWWVRGVGESRLMGMVIVVGEAKSLVVVI